MLTYLDIMSVSVGNATGAGLPLDFGAIDTGIEDTTGAELMGAGTLGAIRELEATDITALEGVAKLAGNELKTVESAEKLEVNDPATVEGTEEFDGSGPRKADDAEGMASTEEGLAGDRGNPEGASRSEELGSRFKNVPLGD